MTSKFNVLFLEEASSFLDQIDDKARVKIIYNIRKTQILNDNELFKKLNDQIWEFRTFYKKTKYRLFAFWDKTDKLDSLVITTHGLIKKPIKLLLLTLKKPKEFADYILNKKSDEYERRKENEDLLLGRNYR